MLAINNNPKASIRKTEQGWRLAYSRPSTVFKNRTETLVRYYLCPQGAFYDWREIESALYLPAKAYSKVLKLMRVLERLTVEEDEFVTGLYYSRCRNITKKQYGYLSGIYERKRA